MNDLAHQQTLDPDFRRLLQDARTGLQFRKVSLGNSHIFVDVSSGPARPFVPLNYRRQIFDTIHGLGHPGVERTRQTISSKFVWPSIRQDVSQWARECPQCQRAKVQRHTVPPIGEFKVPPKRFTHWNIDIVTLPSSNGYRHLLTAVDRLSRPRSLAGRGGKERRHRAPELAQRAVQLRCHRRVPAPRCHNYAYQLSEMYANLSQASIFGLDTY